MNEAIRISGVEETDLKVYGMYTDISSMPVSKIETLRKKAQAKVEAEREQLDNADRVHDFIDLLMDTCIEAAKVKSHQAGSYIEPYPVAEVI